MGLLYDSSINNKLQQFIRRVFAFRIYGYNSKLQQFISIFKYWYTVSPSLRRVQCHA